MCTCIFAKRSLSGGLCFVKTSLSPGRLSERSRMANRSSSPSLSTSIRTCSQFPIGFCFHSSVQWKPVVSRRQTVYAAVCCPADCSPPWGACPAPPAAARCRPGPPPPPAAPPAPDQHTMLQDGGYNRIVRAKVGWEMSADRTDLVYICHESDGERVWSLQKLPAERPVLSPVRQLGLQTHSTRSHQAWPNQTKPN